MALGDAVDADALLAGATGFVGSPCLAGSVTDLDGVSVATGRAGFTGARGAGSIDTELSAATGFFDHPIPATCVTDLDLWAIATGSSGGAGACGAGSILAL